MIQEIAVRYLLLDLMNYRLNNPVDQDDALRQIVQDQKEKLLRLARDIAHWGTNPSELSIVMTSDQAGKYIVLEGNRRLAAVRLLLYSSSIGEIDELSLREQFLKLRQEYPRIKITKMPCIIVKGREEADHWIQLRHTGENKGVGTVKWNAQASSRFSHRMGKSTFNSIALDVVERLKESPFVDQTTKNKIEKIKLTNLSRLVNDNAIRDAVGLQISDGKVILNLSSPEVMAKLIKMINDLAAPNFRVRTIYSKTDRAIYLAALEQALRGGTSATTADTESASTDAQSADDTQQTRTTRSASQSQARSTLIPPRTKINIKHSRLNKIYDELRKLEVDQFTNSVAVMLRVFLELSIDEYAGRVTVSGYSPKVPLYTKIKAVADYMERVGILSSKEIKAIRVLADPQNKNSLFSTHTLNAYVHNPNMAPIPGELKITWDRIEEFIIKLWE